MSITSKAQFMAASDGQSYAVQDIAAALAEGMAPEAIQVRTDASAERLDSKATTAEGRAFAARYREAARTLIAEHLQAGREAG